MLLPHWYSASSFLHMYVLETIPMYLSLMFFNIFLYRSQTKYQIVLTKTDVVFPIDVARRAMQIEEVNVTCGDISFRIYLCLL
jgi:hypothetical protein